MAGLGIKAFLLVPQALLAILLHHHPLLILMRYKVTLVAQIALIPLLMEQPVAVAALVVLVEMRPLRVAALVALVV